MPEFHYQGKIYIRPLGRGICLEDCQPEDYLDEAIARIFTGSSMGDGDFQVEIRVCLTPAEPDRSIGAQLFDSMVKNLREFRQMVLKSRGR